MIRKNAGISQNELADLVGVTATMILKIESEEIAADIRLIQRLSVSLRCDIRWMLLGDET